MTTLANTACLAEIIRRLRVIGPESAARWGRMSAHQMICHLADACRMAMGTRPVSPATGPLPRTLVKWIALYLPLRWPPGLATRPEVDQYGEGTRPVEFASDVRELERLLQAFTDRADDLDGRVHPVFGRMSRAAWLRWAYLHADHHLRQFGA